MKLLSKKMIAAGFVMLLGVSFTTSFAFGPAVSAAAPHCTPGYVCIWDGTSFSGSTLRMTLPAVNHCKNIPYSSYKNITSSISNASAYRIAFYDSDNCTNSLALWTQPVNSESSSIGSASNKINSFRPLQ